MPRKRLPISSDKVCLYYCRKHNLKGALCSVYMIESPVGLKYIGASMHTQQSLHSLETGKYDGKARGTGRITESIQKFGYASHKITILEHCEKSMINRRRLHYIKLYNTINQGLNEDIPAYQFPKLLDEQWVTIQETVKKYKTKNKIFCGIYSIEAPDKKLYIGASINIIRRWNIYRVRYRNPMEQDQKKVLESFNKYGIDAHTFSIIELCHKDVLLERERHYIDLLDTMNSGLNCQPNKREGKPNITDELRAKYRSNSWDKRRKNSTSDSYIVLNTVYGIFYKSVAEAARLYKIEERKLGEMLQGKCPNNTHLTLV